MVYFEKHFYRTIKIENDPFSDDEDMLIVWYGGGGIKRGSKSELTELRDYAIAYDKSTVEETIRKREDEIAKLKNLLETVHPERKAKEEE